MTQVILLYFFWVSPIVLMEKWQQRSRLFDKQVIRSVPYQSMPTAYQSSPQSVQAHSVAGFEREGPCVSSVSAESRKMQTNIQYIHVRRIKVSGPSNYTLILYWYQHYSNFLSPLVTASDSIRS